MSSNISPRQSPLRNSAISLNDGSQAIPANNSLSSSSFGSPNRTTEGSVDEAAINVPPTPEHAQNDLRSVDVRQPQNMIHNSPASVHEQVIIEDVIGEKDRGVLSQQPPQSVAPTASPTSAVNEASTPPSQAPQPPRNPEAIAPSGTQHNSPVRANRLLAGLFTPPRRVPRPHDLLQQQVNRLERELERQVLKTEAAQQEAEEARRLLRAETARRHAVENELNQLRASHRAITQPDRTNNYEEREIHENGFLTEEEGGDEAIDNIFDNPVLDLPRQDYGNEMDFEMAYARNEDIRSERRSTSPANPRLPKRRRLISSQENGGGAGGGMINADREDSDDDINVRKPLGRRMNQSVGSKKRLRIDSTDEDEGSKEEVDRPAEEEPLLRRSRRREKAANSTERRRSASESRSLPRSRASADHSPSQGRATPSKTDKKQCPVRGCPKRFTSDEVLQTHMLIHRLPLRCRSCSRERPSHWTLRDHYRRAHTGERPFPCPHCPHRSFTSEDLKKHLPKHTRERPYVCPLCEKDYTEAGSLTRHIRSKHPGEKP